jgi:hypothetical protein
MVLRCEKRIGSSPMRNEYRRHCQYLNDNNDAIAAAIIILTYSFWRSMIKLCYCLDSLTIYTSNRHSGNKCLQKKRGVISKRVDQSCQLVFLCHGRHGYTYPWLYGDCLYLSILLPLVLLWLYVILRLIFANSLLLKFTKFILLVFLRSYLLLYLFNSLSLLHLRLILLNIVRFRLFVLLKLVLLTLLLHSKFVWLFTPLLNLLSIIRAIAWIRYLGRFSFDSLEHI